MEHDVTLIPDGIENLPHLDEENDVTENATIDSLVWENAETQSDLCEKDCTSGEREAEKASVEKALEAVAQACFISKRRCYLCIYGLT